SVLIDDGIAVGRQRAFQQNIRVELTILIEIDDAKRIGLLYFSGGRLQIASEKAQKRGFATAIGADQADTHAAGDAEIQFREESAAGNFVTHAFERHKIFGLTSGGGE